MSSTPSRPQFHSPHSSSYINHIVKEGEPECDSPSEEAEVQWIQASASKKLSQEGRKGEEAKTKTGKEMTTPDLCQGTNISLSGAASPLVQEEPRTHLEKDQPSKQLRTPREKQIEEAPQRT